jgi:hypothetical protein
MNPDEGATIDSSHTFTAVVKDDTGVRSVIFYVGKPDGARQSFSASRTTGDEWAVSLQGFTDGDWVWNVVARDKARKTTTSNDVSFKVSVSGGGGSGVIANAEWTKGGVVQTAAGRIYFEMPGDAQRTQWAGYVCSGTVVADSTGGRSLIQTAAHCVYDDSNKAFARNVMFIPNQAATHGTRTDFNCSNDPLGCWTAAFGVVDSSWTTRTFPNNVAWDYAYYVVHDADAHTDGFESTEDRLDLAAKSLGVSFAEPKFDETDTNTDYTHALGYSYDMDPHFMYCAEDLHKLDTANWWLGSCDLSGGSSGGPWIQPMDVTSGTGPIISVNSWGYTNRPGMAGPKLSGTTASVVFACAKNYAPASLADGDAGLKSPGDCN